LKQVQEGVAMGIWVELGIFVLAIAFGLWQIHDVKKAREATRRQREREAQARQDSAGQPSDPPG
jgi:heme exporter protein D